MADLETKTQGIRFEPVAASPSFIRPPGRGIMLVACGVFWPLATLAVEITTRMCAQALFDPIPTIWHVLAIVGVAGCNLVVWLHLYHHSARLGGGWLAGLSGAAMAVSGFYALLFAPVTPLAVLAILAYGIGLLPLGPLASLLASIVLARRLWTTGTAPASWRPLGWGLAVGVLGLLALDVSPAATRLGITWAASADDATRARGLSLLRHVGDEALLRRLSYDATGRPTGLLSAFTMLAGHRFDASLTAHVSPAQVREIYYRVTGEPFNARPAPHTGGAWARFDDLEWDADHGGTSAGGRLRGLGLLSSRIDASIAADDAIAYIEWTVEVRNTAPVDREARLDLLLPPGGVVSRATLWVNGEEKEAAYAGRGAVRAAYQRVAVQQRRDPLLVTTKGADRVLAQAFPVPRNGGTMKFKLGITAPLDLDATGEGRLVLPAIADRNLTIGSALRHAVWLEAKSPLSSSETALQRGTTDGGAHRLTGDVTDAALTGKRVAISVARPAEPRRAIAKTATGEAIVQEIARTDVAPPRAVMFVVDGSKALAPNVPALVKALDALPASARVGLVIAAETVRRVDVAPLSGTHKSAIEGALRSASFAGGQDNAPALAAALSALSGTPEALIIWVHGPQPVRFADGATSLEQSAERIGKLPRLALYGISAGPNLTLPDVPWAWRARHVPATGAVTADLTALLAAEFKAEPQWRASRVLAADLAPTTAQPEPPAGSTHIAQLWARDRVLAMVGPRQQMAERDATIALAAAHRIVTPVSGAVVLETRQQYVDAGLEPVPPGTVPTIPEPHEWALMIIAALSLLWLVRRQRHALGRTDHVPGALA
jgi:hypothetical protein